MWEELQLAGVGGGPWGQVPGSVIIKYGLGVWNRGKVQLLKG